jgi:hypothetical protein
LQLIRETKFTTEAHLRFPHERYKFACAQALSQHEYKLPLNPSRFCRMAAIRSRIGIVKLFEDKASEAERHSPTSVYKLLPRANSKMINGRLAPIVSEYWWFALMSLCKSGFTNMKNGPFQRYAGGTTSRAQPVAVRILARAYSRRAE